MESIIRRFDEITWHDSKLIGMSLLQRVYDGTEVEEDIVELELEILVGPREYVQHRMVFRHVLELAVDLNVEFKRQASNQIVGAGCLAVSDWRTRRLRRHKTAVDKALNFSIELCIPAGSIEILASDFILERI